MTLIAVFALTVGLSWAIEPGGEKPSNCQESLMATDLAESFVEHPSQLESRGYSDYEQWLHLLVARQSLAKHSVNQSGTNIVISRRNALFLGQRLTVVGNSLYEPNRSSAKALAHYLEKYASGNPELDTFVVPSHVPSELRRLLPEFEEKKWGLRYAARKALHGLRNSLVSAMNDQHAVENLRAKLIDGKAVTPQQARWLLDAMDLFNDEWVLGDIRAAIIERLIADLSTIGKGARPRRLSSQQAQWLIHEAVPFRVLSAEFVDDHEAVEAAQALVRNQSVLAKIRRVFVPTSVESLDEPEILQAFAVLLEYYNRPYLLETLWGGDRERRTGMLTDLMPKLLGNHALERRDLIALIRAIPSLPNDLIPQDPEPKKGDDKKGDAIQ